MHHFSSLEYQSGEIPFEGCTIYTKDFFHMNLTFSKDFSKHAVFENIQTHEKTY